MATEPLQMPNNAKFALAIQQDKAQGTQAAMMTNGYEERVTTNSEYRFYALSSCGLAPVKTHGTLPPEIGGRALTAGAYVTGAWGAGPVSIIPRLDDRLGWLLLAAFGDVSTVANTKASQTTLLIKRGLDELFGEDRDSHCPDWGSRANRGNPRIQQHQVVPGGFSICHRHDSRL